MIKATGVTRHDGNEVYQVFEGGPMAESLKSRVQRRWGRGADGLLIIAVLMGGGCGIAEDGTFPADVQDPVTLQTPAGALARYRGALGRLLIAVDQVVLYSGVLSDELAALPVTLGTSGPYTSLDSRTNSSSAGRFPFLFLHQLRAQAREARGFLRAFAPDSSPALQGHLSAVEGYAEIYLADLFCSGIPLSTVDFDGNYTLAAGSSTTEVYEHAITLFDSARTLASDSARIEHFAALGRGRALLALGRYAEAAAAVANVPNDYQYRVTLAWGPFLSVTSTSLPSDTAALFWFATRTATANRVGAPSMGNLEGGNGLDYRLSNDPRTLPWTLSPPRNDPSGNTLYFPRKYTNAAGGNVVPTSPTTFTVASGIEARLIEAEAALHANPDDGLWLDRLNVLRQTAWPLIVPNPGGPLPNLADTNTNDARVNLLFRERAFWLYLTGHRQGDLRRLVRQYLRNSESVYPTGGYRGGSGTYGTDVVLPVPDQERQVNPKYTGCNNQNA